jgi:hypothetical protein
VIAILVTQTLSSTAEGVRDGCMRQCRTYRNVFKIGVLGALLPAMAGCVDYTQLKLFTTDVSTLLPTDYSQYSRGTMTRGPVTADDLVDQSGRCSGVAPALQNESQAKSQQAAAAGQTIALQMSECEVVRNLGPPAGVQFGAAGSNERVVVMTYGTPERPIYRFVSGRLVSIERGAEPPEQPRKTRTKKKPQAT